MHNIRKNVYQSHLINQYVHLSSDPAHFCSWLTQVRNHSQSQFPGLLNLEKEKKLKTNKKDQEG